MTTHMEDPLQWDRFEGKAQSYHSFIYTQAKAVTCLHFISPIYKTRTKVCPRDAFNKYTLIRHQQVAMKYSYLPNLLGGDDWAPRG